MHNYCTGEKERKRTLQVARVRLGNHRGSGEDDLTVERGSVGREVLELRSGRLRVVHTAIPVERDGQRERVARRTGEWVERLEVER